MISEGLKGVPGAFQLGLKGFQERPSNLRRLRRPHGHLRGSQRDSGKILGVSSISGEGSFRGILDTPGGGGRSGSLMGLKRVSKGFMGVSEDL